jgi:CRP-like cAMP-binding protein
METQMLPNTARLHAVPVMDAPAAFVMPEIHHDGLGEHLSRLKESALRLRFRRSETIATAGDAAAHIYVVSSGCVRLSHHAADGRRHIADFLFDGDIYGLGDVRLFALSAEAVSPVTLSAYPRNLFDRLGEGNKRLRADIFSHLSASIQSAHRHLFLLSCLNARERVATFLMRMMAKPQLVYGDRVDLPMPRQDIADHLGLTIETVCRALAVLRAEAIVEVPNAHLIVVRNCGALRAIAEGASQP